MYSPTDLIVFKAIEKVRIAKNRYQIAKSTHEVKPDYLTGFYIRKSISKKQRVAEVVEAKKELNRSLLLFRTLWLVRRKENSRKRSI